MSNELEIMKIHSTIEDAQTPEVSLDSVSKISETMCVCV